MQKLIYINFIKKIIFLDFNSTIKLNRYATISGRHNESQTNGY